MRYLCRAETAVDHRQAGRKAHPRVATGTLAAVAFAALALAPRAFALPPAGLGVRTIAPDVPAAAVHKIAVFGTDNRTRLPKRLDALKGSIGMIYNERSHTVCSAFCVADDLIATASHCVYRTKGETAPPPERFVFSRPGTRHPESRFAGFANRGSAQQIVAGSTGISTKPPIEAARDWALIKLQGPVCRGHALPVAALSPDEVEKEAVAGHLYQAAFHRDFGRWSMAYSQPCFAGRQIEGQSATQLNERDFTDALNLVLHTCDTGGASSGSPLLVETINGPQVVAINVGTFVQSRVMLEQGIVVRRLPASPVANTAVSAIAFAGKLEALGSASVLTSAADLRTLQRHLVAAGLLAGPVNGRFDAKLRAAIEQYETTAGLPALGLPTRALLEKLGRQVSGR